MNNNHNTEPTTGGFQPVGAPVTDDRRFRVIGETTFESLGILGVNPAGRGDQKVKCPACYQTHTRQAGQRDLSVNASSGVYNCHRCEFRGVVGRRVLECPACNARHDRPKEHQPPYKCECGFVGYAEHEGPAASSPNRSAPKLGAGPQRPEIKPLDNLRPSEPDEALYEYMAERGISPETVNRNRITATTRPFERGGVPVWCIAFNYYSGDDIVNVKYRTIDKRFAQTPGGSPIPYRMDSLKGAEYAVICEGEFDALAFDEAGIHTAVSTPHGAIQADDRTVDGKMKFIECAFELFEAVGCIYIATDADEHGKRTAQEYARRFGKERCKLVEYPDGLKDANEVLLKLGPDALAKCIADARPFPFEGVITLGDQWDELEKLYFEGLPPGALTGIPELDELVHFMPGMLVVVTGIPSHGKSSFVDWIMTNVMVSRGNRIGLFSPENYPSALHTIRYFEQIVGRAYLPGPGLQRMNLSELDQCAEFLRDKLFLVHPPDDHFTIDKILERFEYLVKMYGTRLFVVDPWNTIEHQRPKDQSETEYTGKILNKIRFFAQRTDSTVIVVAHPKKMETRTDSATGVEVARAPTLYDINGSSHFYNIPDIGLVVFRERFPHGRDTTHINVNKVRSKFFGRCGSVKFMLDTPTQRFYPWNGTPDRVNLLQKTYTQDSLFETGGFIPNDDEPF